MRLNEIAGDIRDPKVLKGILEYDCHDILQVYHIFNETHNGVKFFYRGYSRSRPQGYFRATSPQGRPPRDTEDEIHDVLTNLLYDIGMQASRDNSIFVTANMKMAQTYARGEGEIYIVVPIDGFAYSWSPLIVDLYDFISHKSDDGRISYEERLKMMDEEGLTRENIQWFKEKFQYTNKNLGRALGSSSEVMISGAYYAFSASKFGNALSEIVKGNI